MGVVSKINNGIYDFGRGLKFMFSPPTKGEGDRALAKMAELVKAQLPMYGKTAVQRSVINSIESDFKRAAKKGGDAEVQKMIDNALATPEYMDLLKHLSLDETHLRVMKMQAVKKYARVK